VALAAAPPPTVAGRRAQPPPATLPPPEKMKIHRNLHGRPRKEEQERGESMRGRERMEL